jgi:hypothetical protein
MFFFHKRRKAIITCSSTVSDVLRLASLSSLSLNKSERYIMLSLPNLYLCRNCSSKDTFIKWPQTPEKLNSIKNGFYQKAGFPNVVGCIDGTHVPIQAPVDDEPRFVNRKGFHSINALNNQSPKKMQK